MLRSAFAASARGTISTLPRIILTTRLEQHLSHSQKLSSLHGLLRGVLSPSILAASSKL